MKTYLTGEFADKANVTIRTLRYYDKIGLLKPKKDPENGYRHYSDNDFVTLQRILAMKQIGFSLEDIQLLIIGKGEEDLEKSLLLQKDLINKKIDYFSNLKISIDTVLKTNKSGTLDWSKFITLLNHTHDDMVVEQYINSNNLVIRMNLHDKYSVNKTGWFPWLYSNLNLKKANQVLEIGCGDGSLWKNEKKNLRHHEIFLSDISEGMLDSARTNLGNDFSYMKFSGESIPFKSNYFDVVIANHVLFYMNDLPLAISEISRVLKPDGYFYCSTYGEGHMKEVRELAEEFDSRIILSKEPLYDAFGLHNGMSKLKGKFKDVHLHIYEDHLEVTDAEDLIDYILSCHGNQRERLSKRITEFKTFLQNKIDENGYIHITKECGMFECKNK